jgi:hypothetical protein
VKPTSLSWHCLPSRPSWSRAVQPCQLQLDYLDPLHISTRLWVESMLLLSKQQFDGDADIEYELYNTGAAKSILLALLKTDNTYIERGSKRAARRRRSKPTRRQARLDQPMRLSHPDQCGIFVQTPHTCDHCQRVILEPPESIIQGGLKNPRFDAQFPHTRLRLSKHYQMDARYSFG